jgi:hypothetical protein
VVLLFQRRSLGDERKEESAEFVPTIPAKLYIRLEAV